MEHAVNTRPAPAAARLRPSPAPGASRWAGQGGFTLIELIAVIILLGILAAYLAPRYAGVTDEASRAASQAAASEAYARLKGASQLYLLDTTTPSQQLSDLAAARYLPLGAGSALNIGGYVVKYTQGSPGGDVTIQVYGTDGVTLLYTKNYGWP
ncbi:MAG: type II secretion system GspH family protein [Proteobacteria bacterium]|nr:type II secretion system GspH family protein [Pseudomonadota bacterium]MBU1594984.1 type II secretion system GspH family protein [Pseudomonadota bacterium]